MTHFYIEPRTRKYIKGYVFFLLREIYLTNMEKNFWILLQQQDKMLQKVYKIAEETVISKLVLEVNSRNVEEIFIPLQERLHSWLHSRLHS